jgi:hypothetical protein
MGSNVLTISNAAPANTRAIRDINYIANVALPNAANTVNTNALDLIQAVPYPTTQYVIAQVTVGAGNGANNKNVNAVIQDTPANSDGTANSAAWANVVGLAAPLMVSADNNGAGLTSNAFGVLLPPTTRRFIRAQATGEANGGNANNANLTLQLLF